MCICQSDCKQYLTQLTSLSVVIHVVPKKAGIPYDYVTVNNLNAYYGDSHGEMHSLGLLGVR